MIPRDEAHLAVRYFRIVLADPYSACSAIGGLGRAQAVSQGRAFFLGFHAYHGLAIHVLIDSPVRHNYLFEPCDPQLHLWHASLRSVSGLFLAKR